MDKKNKNYAKVETVELTKTAYDILSKIAAAAYCLIEAPEKRTVESLAYWVRKWEEA
jgi:hypothetical protein